MGRGAGLRVAALLCLVVGQHVEAVPVESPPPTSATPVLSATEGVVKSVKAFDNASGATVINDSNVPAVQVIVIMLNSTGGVPSSSNSTDPSSAPSTTLSALEETTEADPVEASTVSEDASESELSTTASESSSPASDLEDVPDSEDETTESEGTDTETQAPTENTADEPSSDEAAYESDESTESEDSAESDEQETTTITSTTTKKPPPPMKQSTGASQPISKGQKKPKKPTQSASVTPSTTAANNTKNKTKKKQTTTPSPSASDESGEALDVQTSTEASKQNQSHKQPSANEQANLGDFEVEVIYPSFVPNIPGITTRLNSSLNGFQVVNLSGGRDAFTVIVDNGKKIYKQSYGPPVQSAPDSTRFLPPGVLSLNLQPAEAQRRRQQTMPLPMNVQPLWPHDLQANRFMVPPPPALQHVPPMFYPNAEPVWQPYPTWNSARIAAPNPYGFQ